MHVTGAPRLDAQIARALAPYADVAGWRLFDIADDGSKVLVGRRGELFEVDAPGAEPRAIAADGAVRWAAYLGGGIVFATDRDGDERLVLWRGDEVVADNVSDPIVARGRLAWAVHVDRGLRTELFLDGTAVLAGDGAWAPTDVSADGAQVLAKRTTSGTVGELDRIDVATGESTRLTSGTDARFGSDGAVYAIANTSGDFLRLVELGAHGALPIETTGEPEQLAMMHDAITPWQQLAFTVTLPGESRLFTWTPRFGRSHVSDLPPAGVIADLHLARGNVAFTFTDPQRPRNVYVHRGRPIAWTHEDAAALRPIAPEHALVTSFDGTAIHVELYAPTARARTPVVVELHGGPEDAFRPRWQPFEQFLVSRGYAVVQPNVRGSSGYGARFAALDDGAHREDAVRDVGAVLDWIATRPELDRTRVVVLGTSYGGYLALAALARFPDKLRGGIVLSAITDFVAFLEGTRADRRDDRRAEYGDERDPTTRAFLQRISPSTHVAELRAPLLVAHGRRDPRVPIDATDRFVAALRAAGRTVWYVVADDEGHTFTKAENRGVFEVLAVQFLDLLR